MFKSFGKLKRNKEKRSHTSYTVITYGFRLYNNMCKRIRFENIIICTEIENELS